jgi:hypothetical protein
MAQVNTTKFVLDTTLNVDLTPHWKQNVGSEYHIFCGNFKILSASCLNHVDKYTEYCKLLESWQTYADEKKCTLSHSLLQEHFPSINTNYHQAQTLEKKHAALHKYMNRCVAHMDNPNHGVSVNQHPGHSLCLPSCHSYTGQDWELVTALYQSTRIGNDDKKRQPLSSDFYPVVSNKLPDLPDLSPLSFFHWVSSLVKILKASWLLPQHKITMLQHFHEVLTQYMKNKSWSSDSDDHYIEFVDMIVSDIHRIVRNVLNPSTVTEQHIYLEQLLTDLVMSIDLDNRHTDDTCKIIFNLQGHVYACNKADRESLCANLVEFYETPIGGTIYDSDDDEAEVGQKRKKSRQPHI